MNCEDARDQFLAYHDGDLSREEKAQLEAHFDGCGFCRADWDAYLRTLGEISGMFRVAPMDGFTQKVKRTIGKRSRGRFFPDDRKLGVSFAIVSFLLILLVMLAYLWMVSAKEVELIAPAGADTSEPSADILDLEKAPNR